MVFFSRSKCLASLLIVPVPVRSCRDVVVTLYIQIVVHLKKKKEQLEKSVLRLALELCLVVSNPLDWNIDRLRKCNLELHRQLQGRVSIGQFVTLPLFY